MSGASELNLSPDQLAALYNDRGQAKYLQVRFSEATADYDLALQLNPEQAVFHYNRSTVVYRYTLALHK